MHSDDPEAKWQTSPCPKPTTDVQSRSCPQFWRRQALGLPCQVCVSYILPLPNHTDHRVWSPCVSYAASDALIHCLHTPQGFGLTSVKQPEELSIAVSSCWVPGFGRFMPMLMLGNCSILCNFDFNLLAKLLRNKNFYHTLMTNARLLRNRRTCKLPPAFPKIHNSMQQRNIISQLSDPFKIYFSHKENMVESTFRQLMSRLGSSTNEGFYWSFLSRRLSRVEISATESSLCGSV